LSDDIVFPKPLQGYHDHRNRCGNLRGRRGVAQHDWLVCYTAHWWK
jgi:hypothetical protein